MGRYRKDAPYSVGAVLGYSRIVEVLETGDRMNRALYRVRTICCDVETTRLHDSLKKAANRGAMMCQHCETQRRKAEKTTENYLITVDGFTWCSLGPLGFRQGAVDSEVAR